MIKTFVVQNTSGKHLSEAELEKRIDQKISTFLAAQKVEYYETSRDVKISSCCTTDSRGGIPLFMTITITSTFERPCCAR